MTAKNDDYFHLGLTDQEVLQSREKHGVNLLTPPKRPSLLKLYLEKFEDPVVRVLLVAAVFSLIISIIENEYAETIGIIAAILLATGIGFYFEYDANKKFELLNAVNEETLVKVIRNGRIQEIPRKDVVVGDIVVLETGEEIPADGEGFVQQDDHAAEEILGHILCGQRDRKADKTGTGHDAAHGQAALLRDGRAAEHHDGYFVDFIQQGEQGAVGADFFAGRGQQQSRDAGSVVEAGTDEEDQHHPIGFEQQGRKAGDGPGQAAQGQIHAGVPRDAGRRAGKAFQQRVRKGKVPAALQQAGEEVFLQPAADDPADEQQGQRTDAPGCKGQPAFQQQPGDGKAEIVDSEEHRNKYLPDE